MTDDALGGRTVLYGDPARQRPPLSDGRRPKADEHFMAGPTTRIAVTVTFLRQDTPPAKAPSGLPPDTSLVRPRTPSVSFYRYLYDTVGAPYVWWLRRTVPDAELASLLASPGVSLHVLYRDHEPAGFFELDARPIATVNISYFGLMPHAIGQGLGTALLRAALAAAWATHPRAVTVNTCTADHPRALPNYLRAGFHAIRTTRELWDVPNRLGLRIPDHLRV
jgi:GNAT superfamily N-acetyltransferase